MMRKACQAAGVAQHRGRMGNKDTWCRLGDFQQVYGKAWTSAGFEAAQHGMRLDMEEVKVGTKKAFERTKESEARNT